MLSAFMLLHVGLFGKLEAGYMILGGCWPGRTCTGVIPGGRDGGGGEGREGGVVFSVITKATF